MKKNIFKKTLKVIILIIILIALIFICYKTYLYSFARKLENECIAVLGNNFYQKEKRIEEDVNDVPVSETWYTDSKQKTVRSYSIHPSKHETYRDIEKKTLTTMFDSGTGEDVTDYMVTVFLLESDNSEFYVHATLNVIRDRFITNNHSILENENYNFKENLRSYLSNLFDLKSIKTEMVNNKECYVVTHKLEDRRTYIDKETKLLVKIIEKSIINSQEEDVIKEYEFVPNIVTEENITLPDLSNYYVEVVEIM